MPSFPYRPQVQPPAGMSLPFDPDAQGVYSPDEMAAQQPVMQSGQSLQDALGAQSQANQGPTGLAGLLASPIFQAAVPTALTTLSAIFPRHMGGAGAIGMAGLRTMNDMTLNSQQKKQTTAADAAKQRLDDFQRQRLKYVIHHSDIDPSQSQAIEQRADVDVKGAADDFTAAAQKSAEADLFNQNTQHFDTAQLKPGESRSFSGGGQSMTFTKPQDPQPSVYGDYASGDPAKMARATKYEEMMKQGQNSAYDDYRSGDPIKKQQALSWMAKTSELARTNRSADAHTVLDGIKRGLIPPPIISARGGMSQEMAELFKAADQEGYDLKSSSMEMMAQISHQKYLNSNEWQGEMKNIRAVEAQLDKTKQLYMDAAPYLTGFRTVNEVIEAGAKNMPGEAGVKISKLAGALVESQQTFATVMRSGAAITDQSAKAAKDMIDLAMPPGQFLGTLQVAKDMTGLRKWALVNSEAQTENGPVRNPNAGPPPLDPTASDGGGGSGGQFKSKRELAQAVSDNKISIPAAKLYAKAHPELK